MRSCSASLGPDCTRYEDLRFGGRVGAVLVVMALLMSVAPGCEAPRLEDYSPAVQGATGPASSPGLVGDDREIVLAEVEGHAITLAEYQRRLRRLGAEAQRRVRSAVSRRNLLEALIMVHVLAARADAEGLGNDPMVALAERGALRDTVTRRQADEALRGAIVSESSLREYYASHRFRYQRPEQVRLRVLVAADLAQAERAVDEYRRRPAADMEGRMAAFAALAARISIFPADALELGFVSRQDLASVASAEAVRTAFRLDNTGEVSDPVAVAGGFAVFQLVGRRRPLDQTLAEVQEAVREEILAEWRQEAAESWLSTLQANKEIVVDEALLSALESAAEARFPVPQRAGWEQLTDLELDRLLTPRYDLSSLSAVLSAPATHPDSGERPRETNHDQDR